MTDETRAPVYISYRWDGSTAHAQWLQHHLEKAGLEVFRDVTSLRPGDHWPSELEAALNRAAALIVMIDSRWLLHQDDYGRRKLDNTEDWVRREVERGLDRGIPVVPVLVDDAALPPSHALPDTLAPLTTRQAIRLRSGEAFDEGADQILASLVAALEGQPEGKPTPKLGFRILDLELSNFRCFDHLELSFDQPSSLDGQWTCVAGINGAGKSTVLQAIALLVMGPKRCLELGGSRLNRMRRRGSDGRARDAVLRARVELDGELFPLEVSLTERDATGPTSKFWRRVEQLLSVGYGASRNLSESPDRYDDLSPTVKTMISLFDPMARLEKAEGLLGDPTHTDLVRERAQASFRLLVEDLFADELRLGHEGDDGVRFMAGGSPVRAHELPDGFRSSAAWLADLCARWAAVGATPSLEEMFGLVLVDELDLHLHASLQRGIVPRLRKALPGVQFIVTSHSPLVLASFDRHELIALDRDEPGGVRSIDRQVLGFSPDEVYEWLLGTPASSEAMEFEIRDAEPGTSRRAELAELLDARDSVDAEAQERLARFRQRARQEP